LIWSSVSFGSKRRIDRAAASDGSDGDFETAGFEVVDSASPAAALDFRLFIATALRHVDDRQPFAEGVSVRSRSVVAETKECIGKQVEIGKIYESEGIVIREFSDGCVSIGTRITIK
jgi:hypothetical protein